MSVFQRVRMCASVCARGRGGGDGGRGLDDTPFGVRHVDDVSGKDIRMCMKRRKAQGAGAS